MREDDDGVTTGRRGHSRRSYLEKPWHRCWWQTWSWGWGCCCPRGTSPASPHSGVPGSLRCNGTSSGTESEPHRCRDGTDGWRTKCRCTLFPRSSLWLCGLEGTCVNMRQSYKAQTLEKLSDKMKHWLLQSYETYTDSVKINPSGVTPQIPRYALWRLQCRLWSTLKKKKKKRKKEATLLLYVCAAVTEYGYPDAVKRFMLVRCLEITARTLSGPAEFKGAAVTLTVPAVIHYSLRLTHH